METLVRKTLGNKAQDLASFIGDGVAMHAPPAKVRIQDDKGRVFNDARLVFGEDKDGTTYYAVVLTE